MRSDRSWAKPFGLNRFRGQRTYAMLRLRCEVHRVDDALITGAPAEVAGESLADLLIGGFRVVAQKRGDRRDETRCAEAALQPVALAQCGLHRRKLAVLTRDALDGGDLLAVDLHSED